NPCASAPSKARLPALFREKAFTCATLAEAVNHYVDLGEEAANKELESLTSDRITRDDQVSATGGFSRKERISWGCRILFQPKGERTSPPPALRSPPLPLEVGVDGVAPVPGRSLGHELLCPQRGLFTRRAGGRSSSLSRVLSGERQVPH